jgi:hypothetical protein
MKRSTILVSFVLIVALTLAAGLLSACDGGNGDKTPPPTATWTPAPTSAVSLPAVDSGRQSDDQVSPLGMPDQTSPVATPTPTSAP